MEEREGKVFGYECKWSVRKTVLPPKSWLSGYPEAEFTVVTPENYLAFLT